MELRLFLCGMGVGLILVGSYGRFAKADPGATADEPIPPTPALRQALGRGMRDDAARQAQAPALPRPAAPVRPETARPSLPGPPPPGLPGPTVPGGAFAPGAPGGPVTPGTTGLAPSPFQPGPGAFPSFASLSVRTPPEIMGDQGPTSVLQGPLVPEVPPVPGAPSQRLEGRGAALLPFIRQFKIAEMESPRPIDRVYFSFNFYDNLNASINRRLGSSVSNLRVYREFFGLVRLCQMNSGAHWFVERV